MLKKIKKSIKYFVIVIGVIILLPTVLYLLLQTAQVQTFLVNRITKHFSSEIKSTVSVGFIEYKFFNKLSIKNILIKDKNNDTLLYSKEIIAGIRYIDFKNTRFRLGKVSLIQPVIALITDSSGMMNLTWYMSLLKTSSNTVKKSRSRISIEQIEIDNARFAFVNRNNPKGKARMDFNDLNLSGINGTIEDLKMLSDSITFNVYNLGFRESSGFTVRRMDSNVSIAGQNILLTNTLLACDSSNFNINRFGLSADSSSSFKKFTEKVKLNIQLEKSLISTTDLKYFLPFADSIDESIWLSGKIQGTISELRGRNIKLTYRDFTSLDCDFDFSGLPKIENAFIYIGVNSLKTNAKDFEQIRIPGKGLLIVADPLKKLGNVSFNGSFTGFTTDFVTYGEIRTSLGNIQTDISLRPEKAKKYKIKGLLTGSDINIGELTGKSEFLGKLSMKTNVDGYANSLKQFAGELTGKIDSVEINKYVYRNISLNGFFTEKTWDGSIDIVDRNIKLNLLGLLNFRNTLPEFDFTLNIADANLYKLNFDKLDTISNVTLLLTSNFKGNSIDNLDGEIRLLNSNFKKNKNNLELYDLSISTYKEGNEPVLSLRSDFLDADIKGYYNFATIGALFRSTLVTLMPSQFHSGGEPAGIKRNKFSFNFNFKNTDKINNFLNTGILLSDKSYIKGAIFGDSAMNFGGKANLLTVKNNVFKDFSFDANVSGSELKMDINSTSLNFLNQSELKDFSIRLRTRPDNFTFTLNWDNKDKVLNRGNFTAYGTVTKNLAGKGNAILKVDIDSSHYYSDNNLWKLSNSSIFIDSTTIKIDKLNLTSDERSYLIDGSVSKNPADTLNLGFKGIDIAPLNILINRKKKNDPTAIQLDIKGLLNGKILITNVYKSLLIAGNIEIDSLSILGSDFGNVSIRSALDNVKKVVNINAGNSLRGVRMFDVSGIYNPANKKIDLSANTNKLPVSFLNPLLKVFASDISGYASGKLNLSGETDNLVLKGAVMAENASMKMNYLQTRYSLNDTIRFDKQGIKFNNVRIYDQKRNAAVLSGSVNHKNFHDYTIDLIINIPSSSFQVLNTQPKDNPLFYGTAYGSGVAKINIDQSTIAIDISAKTGKNTKLSIPLNKGLSVSEYSFITFADSSRKAGTADGEKATQAPLKQIGMDLNMNLEVTPEAEVQIIFDSKVGDVMKGHGSSENLNVNLNKKGDFKITGDYIIEDGDYTFTLGALINKTFSVQNGGRIMFGGDIKDAEIELKASYLNLKTSLAPVLGDGENGKYTERIPVEPQLNLSGKIFNPVVGFDIYLPDADEATRSALRNSLPTEEELSRQVFSLLLMGGFISMGSYSSASTTSGTSAMTATTFEMVGNQLSNWLSQISKDFDIGVLYRPGYNAINPQEVQLALSTQLLNNKVVLNGNFDVRGTGSTTNSTNQLTGDFDAQIKINDKFQFKVFNRFNDVYTGLSGISPYTQGVGIFYKQDFNRFSDLFRKKRKSDMKKEDEAKIKSK
jgi:hypothetical protein